MQARARSCLPLTSLFPFVGHDDGDESDGKESGEETALMKMAKMMTSTTMMMPVVTMNVLWSRASARLFRCLTFHVVAVQWRCLRSQYAWLLS